RSGRACRQFRGERPSHHKSAQAGAEVPQMVYGSLRSWSVAHHFTPQVLERLYQLAWHPTARDSPLDADAFGNPGVEEAGLNALRLSRLSADSRDLAHVELTLLGRRASICLGFVHEDADLRHGERLDPHLQAVEDQVGPLGSEEVRVHGNQHQVAAG